MRKEKRLVAGIYLITAAQFSSLLVRSGDLGDGNVDANHRAGVAGAGTDPQRVAAWPGGRAASFAGIALLSLWRRLCRPLAQTACLACHPDSIHASGFCDLGVAYCRPAPTLAPVYPRAAAGHHEQSGKADEPGIPHRDGWTR